MEDVSGYETSPVRLNGQQTPSRRWSQTHGPGPPRPASASRRIIPPRRAPPAPPAPTAVTASPSPRHLVDISTPQPRPTPPTPTWRLCLCLCLCLCLVVRHHSRHAQPLLRCCLLSFHTASALHHVRPCTCTCAPQPAARQTLFPPSHAQPHPRGWLFCLLHFRPRAC
jgi:hypothetical protein